MKGSELELAMAMAAGANQDPLRAQKALEPSQEIEALGRPNNQRMQPSWGPNRT